MTNGIIKRVKIIAVRNNTEDARTITLQPLDGWKPKYQSGQFITLVFYKHNKEKRRSYSISSSPKIGEPLTITVKKIDNGEFSRWLVYKAKKGDVLNTSGISGFFVLPKDVSENTFCFLAAGSGITPCYGIIKTLLQTTNRNIFLFYSNKNEKQTIFFEELNKLQENYKHRLRIHFMFSNRLDVYYSRLSHWLLTWLFNKHFAEIKKEKMLFYICGPFDYMLMATISLKNNGIKKAQIFKEDFNPLPPLRVPSPPDKQSHNVTIHIGGQSHIISVKYPQSIVIAAKLQYITVPYSCEAGKCGSCVATCVKGKIWMAYNEVLTDEEVANGLVLSCQGFPIDGDAEIVYE